MMEKMIGYYFGSAEKVLDTSDTSCQNKTALIYCELKGGEVDDVYKTNEFFRLISGFHFSEMQGFSTILPNFLALTPLKLSVVFLMIKGVSVFQQSLFQFYDMVKKVSSNSWDDTFLFI